MNKSKLSVFALIAMALIWATPASADDNKDRQRRDSNLTNVAIDKTVASNGLFFVGGFGAMQIVDLGSVADGVFMKPGQNWTAGAVWWREDVDSISNTLTVYLGGTYKIRKLIVQVDNNDDYRVSWNDEVSGMTSVVVSPTFISFPGGLSVPVEVKVRAVTDQFIIEHDPGGRGDGYYSVSEFQALGKKNKRR